MPALSDNARDLFSRAIPGWATVIDDDGVPHSSVVWVDVDGDEVLFNTAVGRVKERFLQDNPTVSVSVLNPEHAWHWASVSGPASLSTDDGDRVIDSLAKKYLDADSYPFRKEGEQRVTVRVKVDRLLEIAPDGS
ncbi:PPOX class probable F420-dependent enzyme [Haloactinopolyspora alba]|uniref:PPOX class probable F420-dependent enzyme n=1 Tax=Haloactinopolyspora alba TaxID=648780 RepID=A0A2P8E137_9ACTN|nr:PPOX class F420-dependent oxidoreductase [Haloactinopolyspora alba]PSL03183.1 PPOX class probable F420-dependent enzyme [Haloactinopolyspora alba]